MDKYFTQFRWFAATLMLVAAMVMPSTAWAQGTITPSMPQTGNGTEASPYEIGTAAELYWFAGLVNGDASVCDYDADTNPSGTKQNTAACAKLTMDIEVNSNLLANLNADGTVKDGYEVKIWTPIGNSDNPYTGTFDGKGYKISGLYFNNTSTSNVGLFGYNGGTIQNVGVVDSYFKGKIYVGGVCGWNKANNNVTAIITNCYNTGSVSGSMCISGVCGYNETGSITNCYNTGSVSGTGINSQVGGVCGYNSGTITQCNNTGSISGTGANSQVGGVCGYNETGNITNCYNTGSVSSDKGAVGGVCGRNRADNVTSTITQCYNTGSVSGSSEVGGVCGSNVANSNGGTATSTITQCYNTGSVSGSSYVGGVCGSNVVISDGETVTATITNCNNIGSVSGTKYVGGVCGYNYAESNSETAEATSTITNCHNIGSVSGSDAVGGVCGYNEAVLGGGTATATITNCYYLSGCNADGTTFTNAYGTSKTAEQFASGEVAWLLNGSSPYGVWGQTLSGTGKQDYPVLGGIPVYYRDEVYTNTYGTLTVGTQQITALSSPLIWYEFTPTESGTYQ
ncbi:MAG: GLUG motif-containing protein, partial [Paludibacteraceae bacterium]